MASLKRRLYDRVRLRARNVFVGFLRDTVVDNITIIHQQSTVLPSVEHTSPRVCLLI